MSMNNNYEPNLKFYVNVEEWEFAKEEGDISLFFMNDNEECHICGKDKREKCSGVCPFCDEEFAKSHIPMCKCLGPRIYGKCLKYQCKHKHHCIKCRKEESKTGYCCICSLCRTPYKFAKQVCKCNERAFTSIDSYYRPECDYYHKVCRDCGEIKSYYDSESGLMCYDKKCSRCSASVDGSK